MPNLRLIKYPGSKNALLPIIRRVFEESGRTILVDVFGGSGTVSLNITSDSTVYNDLNSELFNLFNVIKYRSDLFSQMADEWTSDKERFRSYGNMMTSGRLVTGNDVEAAFRTFYKFNVGFGGMGSTYRTHKEKSAYSSILKILSGYAEISTRISRWTIENLDFREIISKYDSENVFFYLDPPYLGKSWYDIDFNYRSLRDLKKLTDIMKGRYLCSFDSSDKEAETVFGKPDYIAQFVNQNRQKASIPVYRTFSLYYNGDVRLG